MSKNSDRAFVVGQLIGAGLVAITTLLLSSGIFAIAWNGGAARVLNLPDISWAESLSCLVCLWILATPIRVSRVRVSRDAPTRV